MLEEDLNQRLVLATHGFGKGGVTKDILSSHIGAIVQQQLDKTGEPFDCGNNERGLESLTGTHVHVNTPFDQVTGSLRLIVVCSPQQRRAQVQLDVVGVEHEVQVLVEMFTRPRERTHARFIIKLLGNLDQDLVRQVEQSHLCETLSRVVIGGLVMSCDILA